MNRFLFFGITCAVLGFAACDEATNNPDTTDPIPVENVAELARMNQVLGWKVFNQQQVEKPGENVLISPYSIQTAINMAMNGARTQTLDAFLTLLDCDNCKVGDINALHRDLNTLLTQQSGHPTLTVSNRFFYDATRMTVKPAFLSTVADSYGAGADNIAFSDETAALATINAWVYASTNQKIERILERITALDVAFLINALHFKADWATGFSPELTNDAPFRRPDGTEVSVPFVSADRNFTFAQTPQFNVVDIPFRDSTFSVSLIQPGVANTATDWHRIITSDTWSALYGGMAYGRAQVYFPKLRLAYQNDLVDGLKTLGVTAPFNEADADFTDMGTASRNIFINQIQHKTVLEMDERGAEGAAVTSIGFGVTSVPPTFQFNRPFVLVLRHISTNSIVFLGYVADPS